MTRIAPARPPYPAAIQSQLDELMPQGMEPLHLFRVLARDERLFSRSVGAGLLDRGHLSLREREIVILRVCANQRCEYEWGVHVTVFAARASIDEAAQRATLQASVDQPCWSARERLILRLCDELRDGTQLSDALFAELEREFSSEAILELLLLSSFYRTISVLANGLRMPLETFAARFPTHA